MHTRLVHPLTVALLLLIPLTARADEPKAEKDAALKAAAALYDGIRTETLPNGLRVYLKPIPGAPTVTSMIAYKVGSSDENLDATGLSHYLEHLMFKGTEKIKPGDIDRKTLKSGGANNAYTSEDSTIYHFDFASDKWQIALEVEADRMRNLRIDKEHEFEQEKGAVISELARNEDEPWDLEYKAILPVLFGKTTPYGHPVIGETEHVKAATAEVIKAHYDRWYHPNNASLVIVGGFDADEAMKLVKKLFGDIPAGKLPERKKDAEAADHGKRPARIDMPSKFETPRLLMGFNTCRTEDPDDPVLDVIQALLAGGRTSRFYKKFVEGDEVATDVSAGNSSGRYNGWFSVQVELIPDKDRKKVEKDVFAELQRLVKEPVSDAELERVKATVLASAIFSRESVHGLADSIARGLMTGDLDRLKKVLPNLVAVTAKDVQRVAAKYLDPEKSVVLWSVPKPPGKPEGKPEGGAAKPQRRAGRAGDSAPKAFSLKDTQRVVLPNGLTLLLYENRRLPIVVAEAFVRRTKLYEEDEKAGVSTLVGSLLAEGTAKRTGPQIAETIEDVGGILSMNQSGGTVKVLTPNRKLGLSLLFESLSEANFPKDAFAREKEKLLTLIADSEKRPEQRAQALYRETAYGKHPLGRSLLAERKSIEKLTPEDCKAFYGKVFVPNNTIIAVVGDFDSKTVIEEITALTAGWKKTDLAKPAVPEVEKPKDFVQKILTMPEATQLHFYMGHPGVLRNNPDYYKLLVMDYVLGTGPGFTDRLSARLRDRQGLAYTVSANISSSAGEEPGLFTCYIGTFPEKFGEVKKQFLEELNKIRDEVPTAQEVEDAKQYLLFNLPFRFTTNDGIATQLLYIERNGLGFDFLEQYRKAVGAVTPEDVQAVAKKYLDPTHMVLVAAGPVDEKGNPVAKAPPPKP
jgi:zinc protease